VRGACSERRDLALHPLQCLRFVLLAPRLPQKTPPCRRHRLPYLPPPHRCWSDGPGTRALAQRCRRQLEIFCEHLSGQKHQKTEEEKKPVNSDQVRMRNDTPFILKEELSQVGVKKARARMWRGGGRKKNKKRKKRRKKNLKVFFSLVFFFFFAAGDLKIRETGSCSCSKRGLLHEADQKNEDEERRRKKSGFFSFLLSGGATCRNMTFLFCTSPSSSSSFSLLAQMENL